VIASPVVIPVIETERFVLRGHTLADFDASAAMWGDPAVVRFIGGRVFAADEVWARILRYHGHWALLGFGFWAIEDKATRRFVGEVGFADFKRPIEPPFGDTPEMGWSLASAAHGKGTASEVVAAAAAWGDRNFAGDRTVCIIDPGNAPSIRVAEKTGFREVRRTDLRGSPTIVFERRRGG
jgi:RimJ/RimL family protein N-acetyltransferase